MQRELKLPDVGEGIAEGEIVNWLVEPGDQVTEDQPVAEVETDKAVVEVPSPIHGTVTSLHASEGEVVAVGSVIVTFEVDDADADATADAEPSEQTTDETAQASTDTPDEQDTTTSAETETTSDESVPASQVIAPPRTKRLARELGVDIGAIAGAADGEPISDADVRRASEGDSATTQTEPTPATSAQRPESSPSTSASASGSEDAGGSAATEQAAPSRSARDKTLAAPATRQLARELGVDIEWTVGPEATGPAYHQMGTTRMGTDPDESVVDAECRTHDLSNLWVVGSSVFPTGGAMNPTLTIAALSLRAAASLSASL